MKQDIDAQCEIEFDYNNEGVQSKYFVNTKDIRYVEYKSKRGGYVRDNWVNVVPSLLNKEYKINVI